MGLERSQRLTKGDVKIESLELTPQEYFVLSRVEGSPTVAEVLMTSGLDAPETERILDKLVGSGALCLTEVAPRRPGRVLSTGELRKRAADRRRRTLAAQFHAPAPRVVPAPVPTPTREPRSKGAAVSAVDPRVEEASTRRESATHVQRPRVELDHDKLNPAVAIGVDEQRWILALDEGIETLDPFTWLGIVPTHDTKVIKRAFHETSRVLHPDTYYGRELGVFREVLSTLFRHTKSVYSHLRDESARDPYVDHHIAAQARVAQVAEAEREQQREEHSLREQALEAEAKDRRQQRAEMRARKKRERVVEHMVLEAGQYRDEANAAKEAGNLAKAANLYRLALRVDPNNEEIKTLWNESRTVARQQRAGDAFQKAQNLIDLGQGQEAQLLLVEAAIADPTAEHLAYAADAIRQKDPVRAREFAMSALDALTVADSGQGRKTKPATLAGLRLMIGRAFLAAGQKNTALAQAHLAAKLRPDDGEVRALLKACKAK